ncbi:MAG: outer membrane beta-barrel protein [Parabacteroides sp.]|nr:outer membrane beta-barrel protein [Parabacteroides sp.]MCI7008658.1 outer membrane beta-barrel protein [Parabacteroides sp.]
MNEKRDKWDEAIQAKLFDHEVEPMPEDWEAIASRLPEERPVTWPFAFRYWSAAAAAVLALVLGGLYLFDQDPETVRLAEEMSQIETDRSIIPTPATPAPSIAAPATRAVNAWVAQATSTRSFRAHAQQPIERITDKESAAEIAAVEPSHREDAQREEEVITESVASQQPRTKAADTTQPTHQPAKQRKWSFGMGAGNLSVGTSQLVPHYVTNSAALRSESLMSMNTWGATQEASPKTDIQHHTPINFGISVSRQLSNRFYLQTGLNYSYLRSEWATNGTYHIETDQRLHFLGLPLSIAYRIAEWNRFLFYASAGGMAEVNVAGKRQSQLFSDEISIVKQTEHIRMKEWLWSVNGKVGVSYPIVRFVSAFGEVSANYYFDNGSTIETIHSEKPFTIGFNMGFRLGF